MEVAVGRVPATPWRRVGGTAAARSLGCLVALAALCGTCWARSTVALCDGSSPSQSWDLRRAASWGTPNDVINPSLGQCLDVAKWDKSDGATVQAWQCCCTGSPYCGHCGKPSQNFNQVYDLDHSTSPPRVVTGREMGGKCLVLRGGAVVTLACAEAPAGTAIVYAAGSHPPMRLESNASMCLSVDSKPPAPAPPGPPGPPYSPVPQACAEGSNTTALPFCNPSHSVADRVRDLLSRMPVDDKLTQLIGGIGGGVTPAVPSVGIPPYQYHSEGLHGLRDTCGVGRNGEMLYSTMFPQVTAMAATGNLTLVQAMASHMGDEARAVNNYLRGNTLGKGGGLNYWGPTMNVGRDPRWGRFQESVSEDPWLNGAYAASFVRGFQGAGDGTNYTKIAACCKHFYAYSLENSDGYTRHNFNALVAPRDMAETYGPPFAMCVSAEPEQIMCSYNAVNGIPTCLDGQAQNGWLRDMLGFDGLIVSDCDAVADAYNAHHYARNASDAAALGIKAGCDQDCGSTYKADNLRAALDAGELTVADIDVALGRAMRMRMRAGMFDPPSRVPYTGVGVDVMNNAHGRGLAVEAAQQAVVLLRNDAGVLPFKGTGLQIAVVGPTANDTKTLMGGKNDYCPQHTVTVCEGLQARAALGGADAAHTVVCGGDGGARDAVLLDGADVVVVAVGGVFGHEAGDRTNISLPQEQQQFVWDTISQAGASKVVLVLVNGDPIAIDAFKTAVPTIVEALEGGQAAGTGLAAVLFGDVSPSGMLPFTIYPDNFVTKVAMSDMSMRPNATTGSPGKTYRFYTDTPLWPFGFGLHYTTFSAKWVSPPAPTQTVAALKAGIELGVAVTNTGGMASARTVQLYVRQLDAADAPLRSLAGLAKVFVGQGHTAHVTLNTAQFGNTCAFCTVSEDGTSAVTPGARWAVSVGNGATDEFAAVNITVVA